MSSTGYGDESGGGLVGQMPEVSLAGVLPLLGLVGVGAFWLRRKTNKQYIIL